MGQEDLLKEEMTTHFSILAWRIPWTEEPSGLPFIELQRVGNDYNGSVFLMVQFLHPYMTTGKTTPLTIQNFVGKMMSLLFNMLSSFVRAFLPRTKHLLISAVTICNDFGAQENKICHCFHSFPIYLP